MTAPAAELRVEALLPRLSRVWRLAYIGFGGISRAHLPAHRALRLPVVAIADPAEAARARAVEEGVPGVFADYREMLDRAEFDAAVVLTQPNLRLEPIRACLERGKPVLVEKPLASTVEEAAAIAAASAAAGVPVAVSQNYRWFPGPWAARELIARGVVGRPFFARIEIFGDQDRTLKDHAFYARCPDFLTLQWNNHLADLLRCWLGAEPQRVLAVGRRAPVQHFVSDNLLSVTVDYAGGLTGQVLHSELLAAGLGAATCRIDGEEGSLVFPLWGAGTLLASVRGVAGGAAVTVDLAETAGGSQRGTITDLLRAAEEGTEPEVSARRNAAIVRQVLAEHASVQAGGVWVGCGG